jgi:hypothetical protein
MDHHREAPGRCFRQGREIGPGRTARAEGVVKASTYAPFREPGNHRAGIGESQRVVSSGQESTSRGEAMIARSGTQGRPVPGSGSGSVPRPRSGGGQATAPDLAVLAREAVVTFLHDASIATAEREAAPASEAPAARAAESAQRAAAASTAVLDRIELAAAKLEADITAALQAQAELQAGAGAAAEAAVRAAQSSWLAAAAAEEADRQAKISLRSVVRYVRVSILVLAVAIIIVLLMSVPVG